MTVRDLIDTLVRFDENKEIVFYNGLDDLANKILYYKKNNKARKKNS